MAAIFEINLYRTRRRMRMEGEEITWMMVKGESIAILIMSLIVLISTIFSYFSSKRELAGMRKELSAARSEVEGLKARVASISPSLSERAKMMGMRIRWGEKLSEIGRSVPPGLWISSLSLSQSPDKSGKSLRIEGFAIGGSSGLDAVLEFASRLRASPNISRDFGEVVLSSTSSRKEGDVELTAFVIICNPKVGGG